MKIPYHTPSEISRSVPSGPQWIVEGYVAQQSITEISGKIKVSGKTTLATNLCASVLTGAPFIGCDTVATKVVYITEQQPGPFREALRRAGLLEVEEGFRVVYRREIANVPWPELISAIAADALRDGYGLLVVDTLAKLAGVVEENSAGEATKAMAPLQDAAHDGLGVIVLRHDRKAGGEVGQSARGSSAYGGDADVLVSIRRPEGHSPPAARELLALSRFEETPDRLRIELTPEGYVHLGGTDYSGEHHAIRVVTEALGSTSGTNESGTTVDELIASTPLSGSAVRRAIASLMKDATVDVSGRGVKSDPRRYRIRISVPTTSP